MTTTQTVGLPRRRRPLGRLLSALVVLRLEAKDLAPLSAGLILLNWLHRPVIEMPLTARRMMRSARLRRRLNEMFPF